jgi:hypothetical protein
MVQLDPLWFQFQVNTDSRNWRYAPACLSDQVVMVVPEVMYVLNPGALKKPTNNGLAGTVFELVDLRDTFAL